MEIVKYAGKACHNCRRLEALLKTMTLPCEVQTYYIEELDPDVLEKEGVHSLPTLVFTNNGKREVIAGVISKGQIEDCIKAVE